MYSKFRWKKNKLYIAKKKERKVEKATPRTRPQPLGSSFPNCK